LTGQDRTDWKNRAQFIGVAAQLMRRILVDHARRRAAAKRGVGIPSTRRSPPERTGSRRFWR
jgi:hypothetical protein